jgi:hypothetical protein
MSGPGVLPKGEEVLVGGASFGEGISWERGHLVRLGIGPFRACGQDACAPRNAGFQGIARPRPKCASAPYHAAGNQPERGRCTAIFKIVVPVRRFFTRPWPPASTALLAPWRVSQIISPGYDSSPRNFSLKEVAEQFLELPARCDLQPTARADGLRTNSTPSVDGRRVTKNVAR